mgnify:CR=1 FL=1
MNQALSESIQAIALLALIDFSLMKPNENFRFTAYFQALNDVEG